MSNTDPQKNDVIEGTIIESTGSWYSVRTEDAILKATVRGKLRLLDTAATNPVAVGDIVTMTPNDDGTAVITEVLPRANQLSRRAAGRRVGLEHVLAANIDKVWAVTSVKTPRFNPGFIDRVLVMSSRWDIPAGVIINKIDLLVEDHDVLNYWRAVYENAGYDVVVTSATTGQGIDELKHHLGNSVSLLTGLSGVGKSSLLNALSPSLDRRTGEISAKTGKGKHVTTHAVSLPYRDGYIIDTPGIREFGVVGIPENELSHHFPEFVPYLDHCRFPNCTHDHEPSCAVVEAVDAEEIPSERWASYLNILGSIRSGDKDVGR